MTCTAVGDTIPDGTLSYADEDDQILNVSVHSLAACKQVILVGVPGAFTPTCSLKHVPGFIEKAEELKSKGIINDPYVMKAWAKSYPENKHVKFFSDSSAAYIKTLGLDLDVSDRGFGVRSQRFALLIDDLKVKVVNVESGGQFKVSSAEDMLKSLRLLAASQLYYFICVLCSVIITSVLQRCF
ncbi:PREDICTED: peroxiredoxin-2B isoform X2 [Theobroma cacao]|uniref:Glutaredoxin-dependent peroxiredoxin n=2 Tax=Theobroma cacao TaxID=3641 RepID=A0AB32V050_THECC|nr:PREDICTED: peroxiredoxin-2B isoform X2 [Theobroma cacao]